MRTWLERAVSGRAKCEICTSTIANRELRVAREDESNDQRTVRFCHLECAVDRDAKLAHDALVSKETKPELFEQGFQEAQRHYPSLAKVVQATLALRSGSNLGDAKPVVHVRELGDDDATKRLLDQLTDAPDDRALLGVLADHLQAHGDERGELIALVYSGSRMPRSSPDATRASTGAGGSPLAPRLASRTRQLT
ncbi:MAG: hypothetical protein AB7P03_18460 [Kofleriaceae bacterium]